MRRIPTIAIIAVGRSGTNHFVSTLRKLQGSACYYELFSEHGVFGIMDYPDIAERLSEYVQHTIRVAEDPDLVAKFKERPALLLNLMNHAVMQAGYEWMAYKVFPNQVDVHKLKVSLKEDLTGMLFLTRTRLDTYISLQKALAKGEWLNVETSDLRPALNANAFLNWADEQNAWYEELYAFARDEGRPFTVVNYDTDNNVPQRQLLQTCQSVAAALGIDADVSETAKHGEEFTKQDKTASPFDRISNGDEFKAKLASLGGLDFALSAPLADYSEGLRAAG